MHIKLQRSSEPWLLSCLYKLSKKSFPFSTKSTSALHSTAQRGTQTCGQTPFSRTCALTHTGAFTKSKMTWWLSNHESRNPVFILLKILQIFFIQKRPSLFAVVTTDSLNLHYATDRSKPIPVSGLPAFSSQTHTMLQFISMSYNLRKRGEKNQLRNTPVKPHKSPPLSQLLQIFS